MTDRDLIDVVINNLNQLTVQGVQNMRIILESIQALGKVRQGVEAAKADVQNKAE